MSLFLYGVTRDASVLEPGRRGVGDAEVGSVAAAGLTMLVSEHDRAPALDEAAMWAYESVLESALATGPLVPIRFGTVVSDREDARVVLETRGSQFTGELADVEGAVELSVRGTWSDSPQDGPSAGLPDSPAPSGTDYMQGRLITRQRAGELADRIRAHLEPHARASRLRVLSRPSTPVSAAFLVDRQEQRRFVHRVLELDARLADAELTCTGPWPAYSFVGGNADE